MKKTITGSGVDREIIFNVPTYSDWNYHQYICDC